MTIIYVTTKDPVEVHRFPCYDENSLRVGFNLIAGALGWPKSSYQKVR